MGKKSFGRRLADNEALAYAKNLRTSPQKLNLVADTIRGKTCEAALAELRFSRRRISGEVKKLLESAIANAERLAHETREAPLVPLASLARLGLERNFRSSQVILDFVDRAVAHVGTHAMGMPGEEV